MQGKEREKRLKREKIMLNPARCVYYFDNRFLMAWEKVIPISFPIFLGGNAFAAGEANFGQAMYQCLERSPQYTHDHPRVDLARPLSFGATTFGLFFYIPIQSLLDSFL